MNVGQRAEQPGGEVANKLWRATLNGPIRSLTDNLLEGVGGTLGAFARVKVVNTWQVGVLDPDQGQKLLKQSVTWDMCVLLF